MNSSLSGLLDGLFNIEETLKRDIEIEREVDVRQNEKDMDLKAKIKAMETAEEEDFGSSSISILRWHF